MPCHRIVGAGGRLVGFGGGLPRTVYLLELEAGWPCNGMVLTDPAGRVRSKWGMGIDRSGDVDTPPRPS